MWTQKLRKNSNHAVWGTSCAVPSVFSLIFSRVEAVPHTTRVNSYHCWVRKVLHNVPSTTTKKGKALGFRLAFCRSIKHSGKADFSNKNFRYRKGFHHTLSSPCPFSFDLVNTRKVNLIRVYFSPKHLEFSWL